MRVFEICGRCEELQRPRCAISLNCLNDIENNKCTIIQSPYRREVEEDIDIDSVVRRCDMPEILFGGFCLKKDFKIAHSFWPSLRKFTKIFLLPFPSVSNFYFWIKSLTFKPNIAQSFQNRTEHRTLRKEQNSISVTRKLKQQRNQTSSRHNVHKCNEFWACLVPFPILLTR